MSEICGAFFAECLNITCPELDSTSMPKVAQLKIEAAIKADLDIK